MNKISIRPAKNQDLKQILLIYNEATINTTALYSYEPNSFEQMKEWYDLRIYFGLPIRIAINDNKIVGFASLSNFRPKPGYANTVENSLFVQHSHQRQGIGRVLLEDIISQAKILNKHCIVAAIDADNLPSICLHEKLGFTKVGTFKEIGYKFDRWLDLDFMPLVINPPE